MWQVPWHRVRGSEGQPRDQTLVSHNISTRRGTEAWKQGIDKQGGSDDDKRSKRARLDGTGDNTKTTKIPKTTIISLDSLLTDIFYCNAQLLQRNILNFSTWAFFSLRDCTFVASVQIAKKIKIIEVETGISR